MFYAIHEVLLVHRGPIHEFSLTIDADDTCVEIDQIILHLSRNDIVKKFKMDIIGRSWSYRVPLSIFSLHQLTDLHLSGCHFMHDPTRFNGFSRLTTLYMYDVFPSIETLLHLLSNCPLLKSFTLILTYSDRIPWCEDTICELFKCLHVIEHLTISLLVIEYPPDCIVPREVPTSLVHLKYFCFEDMHFPSKYALRFLLLVIRSSPKLEKLKLLNYTSYGISEIDLVTLGDYSDVRLEHLKEFEIVNSQMLKSELEFVKFILAMSPVLKKTSIVLHDIIDMTEELKILRTLLRSPRASQFVDITVEGKNVPV